MAVIALVPDGIVGLSPSSGTEVRKIQSALPGLSAGTLVVGRASDAALMTFDGHGRGLNIRHGLTGTPILTFAYTPSGLLDRLTDGAGQPTVIERDGSGKPLAVVGPFGQRTAIELDESGWLSAAVDPEGNRYEVTHAVNGLLQTFTSPGKPATHVTYDDGLVLTDRDAAGATMTFAKTGTSPDTMSREPPLSVTQPSTRPAIRVLDEPGR